MNSEQLLGGQAPADFLRTYWQKQPLLIRNAIPGFSLPFAPDELAGLACEPDVESRLVIERGGAHPWQVVHGPMDEGHFLHLPQSHWTLLVQEVNKHVPEMAELLDRFRFIPNWRVDDIMVSYAPAHGSVGPHLDNYDVFLLQGLGRRRWQISTQAVAETNFIPDLELRIIAEFEPDQEWVLEPGDMLYLPPGVAHHGVALEDCMTVSVGFRAPSHGELIDGFLDFALERLDPQRRYGDPDLTLQRHPGQIAQPALERIRSLIRSLPLADEEIDGWFGRYITEGKAGPGIEPVDEPLSPQALVALFRARGVLYRSEYVRFAFIEAAAGVRLFIDGREHSLAPPLAALAALICDGRSYRYEDWAQCLADDACAAFAADMYNKGYLYDAEAD